MNLEKISLKFQGQELGKTKLYKEKEKFIYSFSYMGYSIKFICRYKHNILKVKLNKQIIRIVMVDFENLKIKKLNAILKEHLFLVLRAIERELDENDKRNKKS